LNKEGQIDFSVLQGIIEGPVRLLGHSVMFGANYYSGGPIVLLRIDLGQYDEVFTNEIPGFYDRLKSILPSLYDHHCSVGKKGGFLKRVEEGTLLGHVTEHTAIELQTLAGMDVAYGKTRESLQKGIYNVIFRFFDEDAGIFAGISALNLVNSVLLEKTFDVAPVIKRLVEIREEKLLGPSTQAIVDEASSRKIPHLRLDRYNLVQLGTGKYQKRIRATITSDTGFLSVETADNKHLTNMMLMDAGLPVPDSIITSDLKDVLSYNQKSVCPITIKPLEGYRGEGVTNNLKGEDDIKKAFLWAKTFDEKIIAQPTIDGNIYRLLVINYSFCAASKLVPPQVTGDGKRTVKQLIDDLNSIQNRGIGDKCRLSQIKIDDITLHILESKGLDSESVLPENEILVLKTSGSMRHGSSAVDVTDEVHEFNKFLAERAARAIGLNVAGIDIIAPNLKDSIFENQGKIIEINAAPDFRMHINPSVGRKRNVSKHLVDMLFPDPEKCRIPVISITGTAGKTVTAHLITHCLGMLGYNTGLTSTQGLYIGQRLLMEGDMTYPEHVSLVLKDPDIDIAVLETGKEGILRRGLGYEFADFGIVLNIYDDHIGTDDIRYIEDLAYAKSVVAEQVYDSGYAVLSADYELVYEMRKGLYSSTAFFSRLGRTPQIIQALKKGHPAAFIENEGVVISHGPKEINLINLGEIPLTYGSKAGFGLESILSCALTLYLMGISAKDISQCLKSFTPGFSSLPGRMNIVQDGPRTFIIDYAHNKPGFEFLGEYLKSFSEYKIGVIDLPGDRPDEDTVQIGEIAAGIFDEIIFYEGYDLRGREKGVLTGLLSKGAVESGFPQDRISCLLDPRQAWERALNLERGKSITVIITGRPDITYRFLMSGLKTKDDKRGE